MKTKKAPEGLEHLYEKPKYIEETPLSENDAKPQTNIALQIPKKAKPKKKHHYPSAILMYVFIIAAIASFSIGCYVKLHTQNSLNDIKQDQAMVDAFNEERLNIEGSPDMLDFMEELVEKYPSMYGWLTIDDTKIDYPVMQSPDSEYYLDHDYTGEESLEGAVFADPAATFYPLDNYIVLYGHNMKSGNIFGGLSKYESQSYEQTHSTITFSTRYETNTYKIVSVIKTQIPDEETVSFRYYNMFGYSTPEEFAQIKAFVEDERLYDTGEKITFGDEILVLSTCEYTQENGRLVIVSVKQ
ncbi:MAG: class B sortase [Eubacterium sp.]|nr:class B sortase [Eubacterium sp.]